VAEVLEGPNRGFAIDAAPNPTAGFPKAAKGEAIELGAVDPGFDGKRKPGLDMPEADNIEESTALFASSLSLTASADSLKKGYLGASGAIIGGCAPTEAFVDVDGAFSDESVFDWTPNNGFDGAFDDIGG
jgi:hypothetical protein